MESLESEILKRSYELAYAGFRLSGSLPEKPAYGQKLEAYALELLDAAMNLRKEDMERSADNLAYLARFGADTGLVSQSNAETMAGEVLKFRVRISKLEKKTISPELNLGDIFRHYQQNAAEKGNEASLDYPAKSVESNPATYPASRAVRSPVVLRTERQGVTESSTDPAKAKEGLPFGERERVILEKIGKSGTCRLKDIVDVLPDSSERTLRYDLQALVERGAIERTGPGGPATFYRLRIEVQPPHPVLRQA